MRLHKLTLYNIRSYEEETVTFPEGITLLSGDIGSGKTSILLGVEFALFGIIRGSFSGSSLLRHGADKGSVTLTFEVDDTEVTVHRALKRTSRGVRQDTGWYEIDGERESATAREIKARVIEVLGYPSSLVTKSKSMLYRYTVYTPQEEMKDILRESADNRLEKIRKVLRLDKYRRVKDNVATYARELRRSVDQQESRLPDKRDLEEERDRCQERLQELKSQRDDLQKKKASVSDSLETVKRKLDESEEQRRKLTELEKKYEAVKSNVKTVRKEIQSTKQSIEKKKNRIKSDIEEPKSDLPEKNILKEKQASLDDKIEKLQSKKQSLQSKMSIAQSKIDDAEAVKEDIEGLDTCPTCGQEVDEEHKAKVKDEQDEIIRRQRDKRDKYKETLEQVENKLAKGEKQQKKLQETLEAIADKEKQREIYKERKQRNKQLRQDIEELQETRQENQDKLESLEEKQASVDDAISSHSDIADTVKDLKQKRETLQEQRESLTSKLSACREKQKNVKDDLDEVKQKIQDHEEVQERIRQKRMTHTWLTEHFTSLMDIIEQHVLLTVHQRFDESFRTFFNDLIEDENLLADIDQDFTPRVTQQGYEMDVEDLSGGEKTSVALAYRLAMNDVINDYMHEVRTDDLIVLDEPTDGFSGEQLDRLRDILHGLRASQIILVSHEEKLESITENLIKVRKANHKSQVVS